MPVTAASETPDMQDKIRQAEAAVAALSEQFLDNARREISVLQDHAAAARNAPGANAGEIEALFSLAHNLKGQGGSFGFDLITEVSDALCSLVRGGEPADWEALDAIDHHIRVLRVIADRGIKGDGGALGAELLAKLRAMAPREAA